MGEGKTESCKDQQALHKIQVKFVNANTNIKVKGPDGREMTIRDLHFTIVE